MQRALLILAALLFVAAARADLAEMDALFAKLPPGATVVDPRGVIAAGLSGAGAKGEVVSVEGQPFTEARRVVTERKPEHAYSINLGQRTTAPVAEGDNLLAIFYARAVTPPAGGDEARSELVFEKNGPPHDKSVTFNFSVGPRWTKFYVPFSARAAYAAGEAQVAFRAGYDPQTIELAGFQLLNYGRTVARADLPYTPLNYKGREADAPWRAAAAERIEKLRKGDLTVVVVDAAGKPVPGADVRVKMQRHAYGFGSAINAKLLLQQGKDADRFRDVIARDFNKVVIENHLKWNLWEHDRQTGPSAVAWLRGAGLDVRGHVLVWPGKKNMPKSVQPLFDQPEALRGAILNHIADIASFFRGQLVEWDVLNEPFTNHDVQKVLGDEVLADWFRAARAADPKARLFINDYSILETGGLDTAHQDHYFQTIKAIIDAGAPLEGIGIQGHFNDNLTPIPRLTEILDRFATFGRPIQITELDVDVYDEQVQADYTRDFMTLVFSHPSTNGILTWGFWEKAHWIPSAAMYRADWSLRPAGSAWYDLVFKKWWTPEQRAMSDARGEVKVRGFHGDYVVEVRVGADVATEKMRLTGAAMREEITTP